MTGYLVGEGDARLVRGVGDDPESGELDAPAGAATRCGCGRDLGRILVGYQ